MSSKARSKSKPKSEHPGSAYLRLLRHADLDDFEKLAQHEHATIQVRIKAANQELKLFKYHPDEKIVAHLQSLGIRQKAGSIKVGHLPEATSRLWEKAFGPRKGQHRQGVDGGGLPGDNDFGRTPPFGRKVKP